MAIRLTRPCFVVVSLVEVIVVDEAAFAVCDVTVKIKLTGSYACVLYCVESNTQMVMALLMGPFFAVVTPIESIVVDATASALCGTVGINNSWISVTRLK